MGAKSKKILPKLFRGFAAITAFLCGLCFAGETVAASNDYKGMVDSMLGGSNAKNVSGETYAFTSEYESLTEMLTERVKIASQIGEEGCVLLKNNASALPLDKNINVTVLGNRPYTYMTDGNLRDTRLTFYGGITGSVIYRQDVTTEDGVISSPVTLENALAEQDIKINPALKSFYSGKSYSPFPEGSESADKAGGPYSVDEPAVTLSDCGDYSAYSDACFVVIGRTSGEGRDYLPGSSGVKTGSSQKSAIGLSDEERNLIDVADSISHGKVIVLVNSAVAMEIDELKNNDKVNSILWIGLPGSYGLKGVAKVITGEVSPSGHLSDTYAVNASGSPAAQNFGDGSPDGSGRFAWADGQYNLASNGHYVVMAEGIYTGYYYYETRYADCVLERGNASSSKGAVQGASGWNYADEVAYPFGYGLSYSTFKQEIVENSFVFDGDGHTVKFDVKVTNTGKMPAKDVVQLYVQTPYTQYDILNGVEKPAIQLVAFEKTGVIDVDDSETVEIYADLKYFASYDKTYSHGGAVGGYILEDGEYYFALGNGAHEALNNILSNCLNVETEKLYIEDGGEINPDATYKWDISSESVFRFKDGVDGEYFEKSDAGVTISNQMANADYNYFKKDAVKYLSRSDWEATFPVSYTGLEVAGDMGRYLAPASTAYTSTVGGTKPDYVQFDVDHSENDDENGEPMQNTDVASYKNLAFDDEKWNYLLQQITFDEAWEFAPLGGTNCNMFSSVNSPVVWQIDGPNGNVNRGYSTLAPTSGFMSVSKSDPNAEYKSADMPCAPVIAATFNKELLESEGKIFGEDNLWSRNPIMWAPAMNLHRTPFNSRNHEYYSECPVLTNMLGVSFVRGGLSKGAILSAKHFAFNTQESYREGLCQFFEEQSAREMELRAFQGLAEDVNYINSLGNRVDALGLMSSFSRAGVIGVNGHEGMMKNILRKEWGFKGLISTDMVSRTNFFHPLDCVVNNVTFMATSSGESFLKNSDWESYSNKDKLKSDATFMTALFENMHYYMYSIANSSALNGYAPGDTVEVGMSWWQVALLSVGGTCAALAVGCIAFAVWIELKKPKAEKLKADAAEDNAAEPKAGLPAENDGESGEE